MIHSSTHTQLTHTLIQTPTIKQYVCHLRVTFLYFLVIEAKSYSLGNLLLYARY